MKNNNFAQYKNLLRLGLGLGIIIVLIISFDAQKLSALYLALGTFKIAEALLLGMIYFFIVLIINSFNLFVIIKGLGHNIRFFPLWKAYVKSWIISKFTLLIVGDASFVYTLQKAGVKAGVTTPVIIIDKLISVIILFLIGLYPLILLFSAADIFFIAGAVMVVLLASLVILLSPHIRVLIRKIIFKKFAKKFKGFGKNSLDIFRSPWPLFANAGMTIIRGVLAGLLVWGVFLIVGEPIRALLVITVNALSNLTQLIPLTTSGLGIKEGMATFIYHYFGVSYTVTLMTYLLVRLSAYVLAVFLYITRMWRR